MKTRSLGELRPNKLATTGWFLRRPYTYGHLAAALRRSISPSARRRERTRSQACAWGKRLAESPHDALVRHLGPGEYPSPRELFPDVYADAQARVANIGIVLGGEANLQLLYHLTKDLPAQNVVETGVAYGWSSLTILLAQEGIGGGTLISTDMPYPRLHNEKFVGCVVPGRLRESWILVKRPDRSALPRLLASAGRIDLAHYDSDKTYAGQSWGIGRLWAQLRPGGILIVDDIDYQVAFRDFAATTGTSPSVVDGGEKLIGVLRKPVS